jgi:hypothetical protein
MNTKRVEYEIDVYQLANTLLYMLTGKSIEGAKARYEKYMMEKTQRSTEQRTEKGAS